jgi:hypothetical protein
MVSSAGKYKDFDKNQGFFDTPHAHSPKKKKRDPNSIPFFLPTRLFVGDTGVEPVTSGM